jgi:hypothetical protein
MDAEIVNGRHAHFTKNCICGAAVNLLYLRRGAAHNREQLENNKVLRAEAALPSDSKQYDRRRPFATFFLNE